MKGIERLAEMRPRGQTVPHPSRRMIPPRQTRKAYECGQVTQEFVNGQWHQWLESCLEDARACNHYIHYIHTMIISLTQST